MQIARRMVAWLSDIVRPLRLSDPVFGVIRYQRAARFWEGTADFPALGKSIEVLIDADLQGPSEDQHRFFRELQSRIAGLLLMVHQRLREEAQRVGSTAASFDLVSINVPEIASGDQGTEWEMSFETKPGHWNVAVVMHNWQLGSVYSEPR